MCNIITISSWKFLSEVLSLWSLRKIWLANYVLFLTEIDTEKILNTSSTPVLRLKKYIHTDKRI